MIIDALNCSNWDRELFEEIRAADVTCIHVTTAVWENARETLSHLHKWYRWFREHSDLIMPVTSGVDIAQAAEQGKTGVILGFQGSSSIEDDLGLIEVFYRLNVRVMQLTYNNASLLGAGCYEPQDGGLTRFGKEAVREMNRLGMVIDLSHVGERTSLDAISFSERPVAVTHANPRFMTDIPRSKSADLLKALAENDGMLGCSLYPLLIGGREVTCQQWCEMIARTVDIMGVDRVGLGTDLVRKCDSRYLDWLRMGRWTHEVDYGASQRPNREWPEWQDWFQSSLDFGNIRQGLHDVGFTEGEAEKIMGGNWYRFFGEAFKQG